MDHVMPQPIRVRRSVIVVSAFSALIVAGLPVPNGVCAADDAYHPPGTGYDAYSPQRGDAYDPNAAPPDAQPPYRPDGAYRQDDNYRRYEGSDTAARRPNDEGPGYGEPYHPPGEYDRGPPPDHGPPYNSYSQNEIIAAGHRFFGSVSEGLASVVEYAFSKSGRPNGYILGEDAGGAFVAGLRYGEGTLYTKDAGVHKVFWQGPSIGYDFGGEGSKTMVLVYNLRDPMQIYERYAGVQGSAYIVGGVGIQFQTHGSVTLAPIRSGIGLRLGANVGYLKYTREPTWNPF
jgi:hypothetical protein